MGTLCFADNESNFSCVVKQVMMKFVCQPVNEINKISAAKLYDLMKYFLSVVHKKEMCVNGLSFI